MTTPLNGECGVRCAAVKNQKGGFGRSLVCRSPHSRDGGHAWPKDQGRGCRAPSFGGVGIEEKGLREGLRHFYKRFLTQKKVGGFMMTCFFLKGGGSFSDDRAAVSGPFPSPGKPAQVSAWCRLPEEDRILTLTHLSSARCVPRSPGL